MRIEDIDEARPSAVGYRQTKTLAAKCCLQMTAQLQCLVQIAGPIYPSPDLRQALLVIQDSVRRTRVQELSSLEGDRHVVKVASWRCSGN
jgi:hypothetical protein